MRTYSSTFLLLLSMCATEWRASAQPEVSGMQWCHDFCLCPEASDTKLKCLEEDDVYRLLTLTERQVLRLRRVQWSPITHLKWCGDDDCLCNKETNKLFECVKATSVLTNFIDQASEILTLFEREREVQIAGVSFLPSFVQANESDSDGGHGASEEGLHRKREMDDEDRRNRRRGRKQRRNRKRNRSEGDDEVGDPQFDESEYFGPVAHEEEEYQETNLLPKQEAINSNPMVTAMQHPNRRNHPTAAPSTESTIFQQPETTNERYHQRQQPRLMESTYPRSQSPPDHHDQQEPEMEVPLQRKTVAGRVSEDLQKLTEDVQHVRSDVVFNQRILLVTMGVAGVAMLGVVVLALHACCARRSSRRARFSENGRLDDHPPHHHHPSSTVTKVNLDEAW